MFVHSDILTHEDIFAALPPDVYANVRALRNPRKRAHGWEIHLEGLGARHRRRANGGNYGSANTMAATWDDHGVWMAALYEIDPLAAIAWYRDRDDFYEKTEHDAAVRQQSQFRTVRETATAPWLERSDAA